MDKTIAFLTMTLNSPYNKGELRGLQLIGVPGVQEGGKYGITSRTQLFFDDSIAKPIFRASTNISRLGWRSAKIWLYSINEPDRLEYQVPEVDNRDLVIFSPVPNSALRSICVLDNQLTGLAYEDWKRKAHLVFSPVFSKFLILPELSSGPVNPFFDWMKSTANSLDPYLEIKQQLFFDSLIVQID